ncbi:MAG: DNA translocase FtsK [Acidimicrobiales bacterium]|nr:DNA translocase FtsK [Acidimicrobiales bacterium]
MATKQQSRSRSKQKSTGRSNRSEGRAKVSERSERRESVVAGVLREAFDGHGHDAIGLGLIVVGTVAGLGSYADAAGPVGRAFAGGSGWLLGRAALAVPVALVVIGILLIRGPVAADDHGVAAEVAAPSPWAMSYRPIVGSLLLVVSVCGFLHLTGDRPAWGDPAELFERAGGALGAAIAGPLEGLLATWGAVLVLAMVGIIGVLVLTRMSLRYVVWRTRRGMAPVGSFFQRHFGRLFVVGEVDEVAGHEPPTRIEPLVTVAGDSTGARSAAGAETDAASDGGADPGADDDAGRGVQARDSEESNLIEPLVPQEPETVEQLAIELGPAAHPSPWKLPPLTLLSRSEAAEVDRRLVEEQGHRLEAALAEHGVETRLVGMVVGPTVTRFELELGAGVKVARVTSLHKDIAYAMASPDVRILAPIPGRQAIGIEVPNIKRQVVSLGDILSSPEAKKAKHPLEVGIGRDINGRSVLVNLARMPHLLIAGATGAGKSSCINSLITSVLIRSTPDQVRLILVDPKRVELGQYNRLPHLLTQVVTNPKKAANALAWAVREMERRYDLLSEVGVRDIDGYNAAYDRGDFAPGPHEDPETARRFQRLPYILVVVDELNDLMMVAARDVEESICRIAQMARAVGIHLVIATQRPSVNVITGVIKANIPARLAFAVSSIADSRVILDQAGAERLVGKGDMLLLDQTSSVPQRLQGAWVSESEVRAVVAHWRRQAPQVAYDDTVEGAGDEGGPGGGGDAGAGEDDELLEQAMELVVRSQLGSTSMLQRKLRVGFARAGRLMDLLEQRGVVGPSEGSKARAVLMTVEEFEALRGGGVDAPLDNEPAF